MNQNFSNPSDNASPEVLSTDDVELLISRTVDGSASQAEWVLLQGHARQANSVWKDLALSYHHLQVLTWRVGLASEVAQRVELPSADITRTIEHAKESSLPASMHASRRDGDNGPTRHRWSNGRMGRVGAFTGWALAAMLALAMVRPMIATPELSSPIPNDQETNTAGLPGASYLDALARSLDKGKAEGRVLGQMPENEIIETIPNDDGSYDIVFTRRIVERARVSQFYRSSTSETGQPAAVQVRPRVYRPANRESGTRNSGNPNSDNRGAL